MPAVHLAVVTAAAAHARRSAERSSSSSTVRARRCSTSSRCAWCSRRRRRTRECSRHPVSVYPKLGVTSSHDTQLVHQRAVLRRGRAYIY